MTSYGCCLRPARRNIQNWELDEREASGETPIPGTNVTVQDIVDSFDCITDKIDEIQVSIEFNPSQQDVLADCVASGLCM